jgi:2,3-bisphosphoglycerate-independent phosphoglycerate mutase
MNQPISPLVLLIIDGWGIAPDSPHNAFMSATTPVLDEILHTYPSFVLDQPESNEIGHLRMSSGRKGELSTDQPIKNCIPEVIASAQQSQYYITETKKFGHLTFHFNGNNSNCFPMVTNQLIHGKHKASYDKDPGSQTTEITQRLVSEISRGRHVFYTALLANVDLVADSGKKDAVVEAVAVVENAVQALKELILSVGGGMIITSARGNAEAVGQEEKSTKMPCVIVSESMKQSDSTPDPLIDKASSGSIARIAPTILDMLGIDKPSEMTESSLIKGEDHA